jgi:hypothetical protein
MNEADVQQLIRSAVEPLEREIKTLRAELEAIKGSPIPEVSLSPEAASSAFPDSPTSIPPERSDFARFLQRGLEQEQREYIEESEKAPEQKKGWNPFKR